MANTAALFRLQEIDTTREQVRRRLLELQSLVKESDELIQSRQQVSATQAELQAWQTQQKNAELEGASLEAKIREENQRLMSGRIRSPKELEALQSNIDSLTRHYGVIEDRTMEALLHVEELSTALAAQRQALAAVQKQWVAVQRSLIQEGKQLQQRFGVLKEQRATLLQRLPAETQRRYEEMRKRRGGIAIAAIQNELCSACFVKLPTGVVSAARQPEGDFVLCPSCGRILHSG